MNYGDLRTQFTSLLNRRDLTAGQRDTFLQQALSRAQRTLRVPAMERSVTVTIDDSYDELSVPSDLIELIGITYLDAVNPVRLEQRDIEAVLREARYTGGASRVYARRGGKWLIGPVPAPGDVLRIDYYAEFATLTADTDANFLSDIAPDVILHGALAFACRFYQDKRQPDFEQAFHTGVAELQSQADRDAFTGGAVIGPALRFDQDCW